MFSHIVTAAKGLFARQSSNEPPSTQPDSSPINPSALSAPADNSKMVTATRRRTFSPVRPAAETNGNGSEKKNGKRKSGAVNTAVEVQVIKKRKTSPEITPEEDASQIEEPQPQQEANAETEEKAAPPAKKHFRFDSEEPELPVEIPMEEPEKQPEPAEEDSSDDDEAPEAVDNSAEMSRLRQEAKKQEEIKQREEQLKREKRKKLDDLRKAQAKAANKKKEILADDLSESTATLQGSITQDARRAALPALLPDDILNAAPVARPPTPPADGMDILQKKPNKLKFLDKKEKRPKDVHMGDVTIRVLDDNVPRKTSKTTLPPKSSKAGLNSKQGWLNRARSTGHVNGLRRTTGGPSGFVRR